MQVINASTVCLMGHERRLTLSLIANMARTLYHSHPPPPPRQQAPPTATLFDQSSVELVIDQVYYGPFCCAPVLPYDRHCYAVYTYEYAGSSSASTPPCCDVTLSPDPPSSPTVSSTSSSCCAYCDACPQCAAAAAPISEL